MIFFFKLRAAEVPVSLTEFLSLLEALQSRVFAGNVDRFYYVSRAALVKDERHFDRFDKVFGAHFRGSEERFNAVVGEIPVEWLRRQATLVLSDEEKAHVEALGGWEALMDTLRRRLEEQGGRHQGGSTWIGTAGTSPFGANGYEAEGVRIGQQGGGQGRAVKVWDKRQYRNLDTTVELGTRNIKLALRRLRRFAREGAAEELDMEDTVRSTANNAGYLDIKMVPERHNAARVLLCLDVGAQCIPMCGPARNCSRRLVPNSSIWNTSIFVISSTSPSERTIAADTLSVCQLWRFCASMGLGTRASSWVTRP